MFDKDDLRRLLRWLLAVVIVLAVFAGCKREGTQVGQSASDSGVKVDAQQVNEPVTTTESIAAKPTQAAKTALDKIVEQAVSRMPVNESWFGKPAPDFAATDLAGSEHKLSDYKGKKVMLVFWATWCPACRAGVPHLKELRRIAGEKDVALLAIAAEELKVVKAFVDRQAIDYTVLLEKGNLPVPFGVGRLYGSTGLPGAFFIDSTGVIRLGTAGAVPLDDMKAILDAI